MTPAGGMVACAALAVDAGDAVVVQGNCAMAVGAAGTVPGSAKPELHHEPWGLSDRIVLLITKGLHHGADLFFAKRHGHRAVEVETVAALPGMAGASICHLSWLRCRVDDDGWIRTLMAEAEIERMHLMAFVEIAQPTGLEPLRVLLAQGAFYIGYFGLDLAARRTVHRLVGHFEEVAVLRA